MLNPKHYLYIEILKCSRVPPQQVCGVLGKEADTEQTLHPLEVRPVHHLREQVDCQFGQNDTKCLRT